MKKLLVALDGSDRAAEVLDVAQNIADCYAADLLVLRATSIDGELPIEAYASSPDDIAAVLETRALVDLKRIVDGSRFVTRLLAVEGVAEEVIDCVAREENVDAIVIGARGYESVGRALGTVAARVVDRADRPVFVVRKPW